MDNHLRLNHESQLVCPELISEVGHPEVWLVFVIIDFIDFKQVGHFGFVQF